MSLLHQNANYSAVSPCEGLPTRPNKQPVAEIVREKAFLRIGPKIGRATLISR